MQTIEFNGDHLSKLSLGTVQFGLDYGIANSTGQPDIHDVKEIIDYVLENGINCFDTASAYGNSEEVLGKVLNKEKTSYIISKLSSDGFIYDLEGNVEQSLQRLQCKTLYGLLLHDSKLLPDWNTGFDNTVAALLASNKVKRFGISIYTESDFNKALENTSITIIQIPFNIFDQRAINDKWFTRAKEANKLIFVRSVFLQGLFFMKSKQLTGNLVEAIPYLEEMHKIRSNLNLSITEFIMAYVNSVAIDAVILFGCNTLKQARENVNSYHHLSTIDRATLDKVNAIFSDVPEHITNPVQWNS